MQPNSFLANVNWLSQASVISTHTDNLDKDSLIYLACDIYKREDCRDSFFLWEREECSTTMRRVLRKYKKEILDAHDSFYKLQERLFLVNSFFSDSIDDEIIAKALINKDELDFSDALIDLPIYDCIQDYLLLFLNTESESVDQYSDFNAFLLTALYAAQYLSATVEAFCNIALDDVIGLLSDEFFMELTHSLGGYQGYQQLCSVSTGQEKELFKFYDSHRHLYSLLSFARLFISTEEESDKKIEEILKDKHLIEYARTIVSTDGIYENLQEIIQKNCELIYSNYSDLHCLLSHIVQILPLLSVLGEWEIIWLLCNQSVHQCVQKKPHCLIGELTLCAAKEGCLNFIAKTNRGQNIASYIDYTDEQGSDILDCAIEGGQEKVLLWLVRCRGMFLEKQHVQRIKNNQTLCRLVGIQRILEDYKLSSQSLSPEEEMYKMAQKTLEQHRRLQKVKRSREVNFYVSDEDVANLSCEPVNCNPPLIKSDIGKARNYMEDESFFVIGEKGTLFGVCDGHSGDCVAKQVSKIFEQAFFISLEYFQGDVYKALKTIAQRIRKEVAEASARERCFYNAGTTVVACFVDKAQGKAYILNVGDSSAFICRKDKEGQVKLIPGCYVRNWADPDELYRAHRASGDMRFFDKATMCEESYTPRAKSTRYPGVTFGLNMSRSIGDTLYAATIEPGIKGISSEEDIIVVPLQGDDLICLYTDGFSDFVSTASWYTLLQENHSDEDLLQIMVDQAVAAQSASNTGDNVTVVLLRTSKQRELMDDSFVH